MSTSKRNTRATGSALEGQQPSDKESPLEDVPVREFSMLERLDNSIKDMSEAMQGFVISVKESTKRNEVSVAKNELAIGLLINAIQALLDKEKPNKSPTDSSQQKASGVNVVNPSSGSSLPRPDEIYVPPPFRAGQVDQPMAETSQGGGGKKSGNSNGQEIIGRMNNQSPTTMQVPKGKEVIERMMNPLFENEPRPYRVQTPPDSIVGRDNRQSSNVVPNSGYFRPPEPVTDNYHMPIIEYTGQRHGQRNYGNPQNDRPDHNEVMNMIEQYVSHHPNRRIRRPMYRKPYLEWIDQCNEFPRSFRCPDFSLFSGEERRSTVEHVGRFTIQCGELANNEFYKLRLFGNSLTGPAFVWYINLPPNSIHSWEEMEESFHKQFVEGKNFSARYLKTAENEEQGKLKSLFFLSKILLHSFILPDSSH